MAEDGIIQKGAVGKEGLSICKNFEGQTVVDMFNYWYGLGGQGTGVVQKDAPALLSTGSGVYNPIYSYQIMSQLINTHNAFSAIGMLPYRHSGYRAATAKSGATIAIAEGASVPASAKPTLVAVQVKPGLHFVNFDMGSLTLALEGKDDVITFAELMNYMSDEFMGYTDVNILADVAGVGAWTVGFDSFQRLIANNTYLTAEPAANDLDPWSTVDRDGGAGWSDCQMVNGTIAGNAETDVTLSLSNLDSLVAACAPYWKGGEVRNKCLITGFDTVNRVQALMMAQAIWHGWEGAAIDVNGVKTMPGQNANFLIAAYDSIPMVPDYNMVKDTISRIALVDKDHFGVALLTPLLAFDTGPSVVETALYTGTLTRRGAILMQGQIWCDLFAGQGMITGRK
jgi:hypothetical protein